MLLFVFWCIFKAVNKLIKKLSELILHKYYLSFICRWDSKILQAENEIKKSISHTMKDPKSVS